MATIIVTNTYEDAQGAPLSGTVTFTPVATGDDDANTVFIADPTAFPVTNGTLSATLLTTDSFEVGGAVTYRVVERVGALYRSKFYVALPSTLGASVVLSSLQTYNAPPNTLILSGGTAVDLTTHLSNDHGPITTELTSLDTRIDALEAGAGVGAHNSLTGRSIADGHPTSAITGLDAALAGKQAADADLTAFAALTPTNDSILQRKAGAWTYRTPAQVRTDMGADASAVETLTNKSISGTTNTLSNIPQDAVTGLEAALNALPAQGLPVVEYNEATTSYPNRSDSGISDPTRVVLWIGGPGPSIGGTGATGAVGGKDLWAAVV